MKLAHSWHTFTAAPHRMFFFAGAVQLLLTMIWWLADLTGRYSSIYSPISWTISPLDAHAFLMIYSLFPLFIFGFLMTTYPRWMNGEEVKRHHYVGAWSLLIAGIILFYVGLIVSHSLLVLAISLFLAGWTIVLYALLDVYLRAQQPDKRHATITSVALLVAWLLIAVMLTGDINLINLSKIGGIWLFLLPIFFAVSHRMIPFFSNTIIADYTIVRPNWALVLIIFGGIIHAILELAGQQAWLWLIDLPMALGALYLTYKWGLRDSFAVPLLAMLHIGFLWLGVALLFYSIQSLVLLTTEQLLFAKAPLHALTIGYFSSMMMAMVTRVTLGHSGATLKVNRPIWLLFISFQAIVITRILSELPSISFTLKSHLYLCSAVLWLACFGFWFYSFSKTYWRVRSDGRPG